MSKQWVNSKGRFSYGDLPTVTDKLPKGVYELGFDAFLKEFFLTHTSDSFGLPEKVYGIEKGLNTRIIQTYNSLNKNFGVLLKGLKGTGKTVLAKQVCNELELPTILVNQSFDNMGGFINSIDQDVIILFDEFEKTYSLSPYDDDDGEKKSVDSLLTLMDGVFTSKNKRLFILTTNNVNLPDAMISRPSRIRYIKEFGDLTMEDIHEVLLDSVDDSELIPGLVEILKELKNITVDIVKSMAEEANIYGIVTNEFFEIFNVTKNTDIMEMLEIIDGEEVPFLEKTNIYLPHYHKGARLRDNMNGIDGSIVDLNVKENTFTLDMGDETFRKFKIRKGVYVHQSMLEYTY